MAVNMEIIKKSGAWFSYNDQRMQGREGVKGVLLENPNLYKQLDRELREAMGLDVKKEISANGSESKNGEAKTGESKTKEKEKAKK
jgi:recombination protein RecA